MKRLVYALWLRRRKRRLLRRVQAEGALTITNYAAVSGGGRPGDIRIGRNCHLGGTLMTQCGGKISIGENTYIGNRTHIGAKQSVAIGRDVIISDDVTVMDNDNHPTDPAARRAMSESGSFFGPEWGWHAAAAKPVVIGDNVWIGKRAAILKGVTVGAGAVVALGAIVTHDVPPYALAAGNPARVVKMLPEPESRTPAAGAQQAACREAPPRGAAE